MATTQNQEPEVDTSFDLTGLAAVAEKAGIDIDASPDASTAEALADAERLAQEKFEEESKTPAEGAETDEQKAAKLFAEADAKKAAEEALAGQTDEEKAAAEAAKAEEDAKKAEALTAKAAEDAKKAELAKGRDADLEIPAELAAHMRPSQKKAWNEIKDRAQKARDAAEEAAKKAAAAEARAAEIEAKTKDVVIPEDLKAETEALRQQVRELDAERDPEIVKKYDTPIQRNEAAVIDILKKYKFDKTADDKGNLTDAPEKITDLQRAGITFGNLSKSIAALEKAGAVDDAETLREFLRENIRLRRDRGVEVQAIKADIDSRKTARQQQGTDQFKQTIEQVMAEGNRVLAEDLGAIAKKHTFLVKPEILATDTPAQVTAKKAALAEFEKVDAAIGKVAQAIATVGKQGKEYVAAEGRKNALAIQSIVLKERVLPRLEAQLTTAQARIKELEGELGKIKGAGAISRAHGAAAQAGGKKVDVDPKMDTGDALKDFAAKMGVSVNT